MVLPLFLLLTCSPGFQDDPAPKDDKVDIKTFVPTREPKKIPEDLRAAGPFDDEYPIPQDRALAATLRAARLEWNRRLLLSGFDQSADKSAPWLSQARKALESIAAVNASANPLDSRLKDAATEATRLALLAECDHPLVIMQAFPYHGLRGETERSYSEAYGTACDMVLKGPYPAAVKAREAWDAAVMLEEAERGGNSFRKKDYYGQFWTHFIELAKSTDVHDQSTAVRLAARVHDRYVALGQKRLDGWNALKAALDQAKAGPSLRGVIEGEFRMAFARDAKTGTGEPDEKKKLVKERLTMARKALTEAWTADPKQDTAATDMVRLCTQEDSNREEMELWFGRALTANPDNIAACFAKLDYFDRPDERNPKAMVTFGRQCLRAGNDHAFLGLILYHAHARIERTKPDEHYFSTIEPWADVREVFESRLKSIPECRYSRSRWGLHCLIAGEGPGALHNLLTVKVNPWPEVFARRSFDESLAEARRLAREQSNPE